MKIPKWTRQTQQDTTQDPEPLSPIALYEASGRSLADAPARTQAILMEAERAQIRRRDRGDR